MIAVCGPQSNLTFFNSKHAWHNVYRLDGSPRCFVKRDQSAYFSTKADAAFKLHTPLNDSPHIKQIVLSAEKRRYYSDETKSRKDENLSDKFAKIGGLSGLASVIGTMTGLFAFFYTIYKEEKVDEKLEKNEAIIKAAKKIGLVEVVGFAERTLAQQVKDYGEAKHELFIIGTSGTRIFDPKHKGKNPIPQKIEELLANGVRIKLMICSPDDPSIADRLSIKALQIDDSIKAAKVLKAKYPKFEIKFIGSPPPPFHGDLIDQSKAHIIPILQGGLRSTNRLNLETYVDTGEKMADIIDTFEAIWKQGKDVN